MPLKFPEFTGDRDRLSARTLEYMRDAVMIVDNNGIIVSVNPAFQALFNLKGSAVVGKTFVNAMIERTEFTEFTDTLLQAIYEPDKTITRDVLVTPDGEKRYLSVRTSVLAPDSHVRDHGLIAVVSDETDRVRFLRSQTELGRVLLTVIVSFALSLLATNFLVSDVHFADLRGTRSFQLIIVPWGYMVLLALPSLVYIIRARIPLSSFGVTVKNWQRALAESAAVFICISIILAAMAFFLHTREQNIRLVKDLDFNLFFLLSQLFYLPHSYLQEFIARGVLQTSIRRLLYSQSELWAIFIAAIVFSSMHAAWGYPVVFFTFISSFVFGWLFSRHKTLIGVGLLHWGLGVVLFFLELV